MAYEVTDLTQVTEELRDAEEARKKAEQYQMDHGGKPLMMYPKACSWIQVLRPVLPVLQ